MSKHTPGPWVYKREIHRGDVDNIATVAWVADIRIGKDCGSAHMCNYESHGPNEADARLIAAAPDLLEALKECLHQLRHFPLNEHDMSQDAMAAVRARVAIAKATGEQQ